MKLYQVTEETFAPYGKVLDLDTEEMIAKAAEIPMPEVGSVYEAGVKALENLPVKEILERDIFGEMDVQVGYCYGHNDCLGALEWHKSSEINVAVTDMILFLGTISEMEDGVYPAEKIKAFLVKKGTALEVYATTLHFCPCETEPAGFGCIVVLPKGTNLPLPKPAKDPLLFRRNKWLIAHPDNTALAEKGAVAGIKGKNYKVGIDL